MDLIYKINRFLYRKIGIALPIPMENHYYKWRRLGAHYNFFCKNCFNTFHLSKVISNNETYFSCPKCGSKSICSGIKLSKAIIDKKSIDELLKICREMEDYHKWITSKIEEQKRLQNQNKEL